MGTFFESKLGLLIVDKLFLALILLVFGLWINRTLERFKSQQSFHSEINKQRVAKMAAVWEAISGLEQLIWEERGRMTGILWHEMKKANISGLPPEPPWDPTELSALVRISKDQPAEFHRVVIERNNKEVQPLKDRAHEKARATAMILSENRFWLGEELYAKYGTHYDSVVKMLDWWHRMAEANELEAAMDQLKATREDVSSALARLRA